jgi:putative RecB family exonuclease
MYSSCPGKETIMPEGPITHFSYSQLNTYLTCPLRYRFQYVELIPPAFTSAALVFGSAVHEAVAVYYQSRLEGDELRPDQMVDVYRETWAGAEKVKFFNGDGEESQLEKARQMIEVFHRDMNPETRVLGVEEFFEVQLAKEVPPFQGYIDLIEEDQDGRVTVADLKTASKKLADSAVHSNLQLTAYSLGAAALGFDPEQLTLRLDVVTKTKNPELVRYGTTRTECERERFVKLVRRVWAAIENNAFFPMADWHCAQCAWVGTCEKW